MKTKNKKVKASANKNEKMPINLKTRLKNKKKIPMWSPEIASICAVPDRWKSVLVLLSRVLIPIREESRRSPSSLFKVDHIFFTIVSLKLDRNS
jgi:hypothetical protein